MINFSPSPWSITKSGPWKIITDNHGHDIAQVEFASDACLMKNAPSMLEEIYNDFIALGKSGANSNLNHPNRKDWERKRAIISQARGEV